MCMADYWHALGIIAKQKAVSEKGNMGRCGCRPLGSMLDLDEKPRNRSRWRYGEVGRREREPERGALRSQSRHVHRSLFARLGRRHPGLFPVYGVNTPYTNRARLGKKHAHNRFWLDRRRVTWPLQRAAFPKAALSVMVGEHPNCAVAMWCEIETGIKGVVFFHS